MNTFTCPSCGALPSSDLQFYQPELFNAHSLRFGPWCVRCGARALPEPDLPAGPRPPLLLISGSCASGKSTVSYLLAQRYGCVQIDGDWILHLRRRELGHAPEYPGIDADMLAMAAGILALGRAVVIAHVILPAQLVFYADFCAARGIAWQMAALLPREEVLLERNRTRVCWPKTTPEYWVLKFHADLQDAPDTFKRWYYDNSLETPAETAQRLAERLGLAGAAAQDAAAAGEQPGG